MTNSPMSPTQKTAFLQPLKKNSPNGLPNATIVRDGWRVQAATNAKHHQLCFVDLQRSLKYFNEKYSNNSWANNSSRLLEKPLRLIKEDRSSKNITMNVTLSSNQLEQLLEDPPEKKQKERNTFYKSIKRERQKIFNFLYIENVPPVKNGLEWVVRNIKVKQKISGQFKVSKSEENFDQINNRYNDQKRTK